MVVLEIITSKHNHKFNRKWSSQVTITFCEQGYALRSRIRLLSIFVKSITTLRSNECELKHFQLDCGSKYVLIQKYSYISLR